MLRFQVITLFPELFSGFQEVGLVSRAMREGLIELELSQLRDFAISSQGQVDDTPYGGGSGMVLRPDAAAAALEAARSKYPQAKVVLFSPRGQRLTQEVAQECAKDETYILLSTRYEGVDQRIIDNFVDLELSMGDYVLQGGEVPAMAFIEATSRLIPGVLGNAESIEEESFQSGLLEYPQYTKPREFDAGRVPDVLLSGHHAEIEKWRKYQAEKVTLERRPDLLLSKPVRADISLALIHYPVKNKEGKIITSSLTNLDLHDIARASKTYAIEHFYAVHPVKALRRLGQEICEHWESGFGSQYNHNRREALETIRLVPDLADVLLDIEERAGCPAKIVTTSACPTEGQMSYRDFRARLRVDSSPYLLLFGTGWGLSEELLDKADLQLEPIWGPSEYNHLSVRSAVSIILDKLLGNE